MATSPCARLIFRGARCPREELTPNARPVRYLKLFNAIVLDVCRTEQSRAREIEKLRANRVAQLTERLDRLEEAFIFDRSIDRATYEKQRDRTQEELTLANLELQDSRIEAADTEGILAFAGYLLENASRMWLEANLEQRQRIQSAIFPRGTTV